MKAQKILQASMLDILFENRNKTYGAYELRINYPRRMRKAIASSITVMVIIFIGLSSFTKKGKSIITSILPPVNEATFKEPIEEQKKPKEKQEKIKKGVLAQSRAKNPPQSTPNFVNDLKQVNLNNKTLADNPNGNPYIKFGNYDDEIGDPEGDDQGKKVDKKIVFNEDKKDTVLRNTPQLPSYKASYVGGWDAFLDYLQSNLSDEAVEDNIDKKITVSFWIETNGSITNVTAYYNDDVQFVKKAIKVFEKMKKWQPAMEKGVYVRQQKILPVTIVLPE